MSYHRLVSVLLLLWVSFLQWDAISDPSVVMVQIFLRKANQSYNWSLPSWSVPSTNGTLANEVDCRILPLIDDGPHFAVVKFADQLNKPSAASNEVSFWWNPVKGCTPAGPSSPPPVASTPPIPPATVPPPPPTVPPTMAELPFPPPPSLSLTTPPVPQPTVSSGGPESSCLWTGYGCGAPVVPPMPASTAGASSDAKDSCLWTGQPGCR